MGWWIAMGLVIVVIVWLVWKVLKAMAYWGSDGGTNE